MSATHIFDDDSSLIITTWDGEATDASFLSALDNYLTTVAMDTRYERYNEIVDISHAKPMSITIEGLITIGQKAYNSDRKVSGRRMAVIVDSQFMYGFIKLYAYYRNMGDASAKTIDVFINFEQAFSWAVPKDISILSA